MPQFSELIVSQNSATKAANDVVFFTKDPKSPEVIPDDGIEQAIELMRGGRLYRYNFDGQFATDSDREELSNEPACQVALLEDEFSSLVGHDYAVAVNSCGCAIFLALKAAGVKHGDEVFTNAFTFTAVPSSIVHAGGKPVYVECTDQYVIDVDDLQKQIAAHPQAKCFVLSHMRGHIADMERIEQVCSEAGIFLIEDCAHSLGCTWRKSDVGQDIQVGHFGRIACFSSQSYKMLNSGEGGIITTNDPRAAVYCILAAGSYEYLYKKHIARPSNDDLFEELKPIVPNFSLRMSNLTAAVIRPQLKTLQQRIEQYNELYDQLKAVLSRCEYIHVPEYLDQASRVGDSIQFNLVGMSGEQVDQFLSEVKRRGVGLQIFGRLDNSRYYKNWKFSFETEPELRQTDDIISLACDLRISLTFDQQDIDLLGTVVTSVIEEVVATA